MNCSFISPLPLCPLVFLRLGSFWLASCRVWARKLWLWLMWSKGDGLIILYKGTLRLWKRISGVDVHYFCSYNYVHLNPAHQGCRRPMGFNDADDLCGFAPEAANIAPQSAREITSSLAGIRCVFAFSVRLRQSVLTTLYMHALNWDINSKRVLTTLIGSRGIKEGEIDVTLYAYMFEIKN